MTYPSFRKSNRTFKKNQRIEAIPLRLIAVSFAFTVGCANIMGLNDKQVLETEEEYQEFLAARSLGSTDSDSPDVRGEDDSTPDPGVAGEDDYVDPYDPYAGTGGSSGTGGLPDGMLGTFLGTRPTPKFDFQALGEFEFYDHQLWTESLEGILNPFVSLARFSYDSKSDLDPPYCIQGMFEEPDDAVAGFLLQLVGAPFTPTKEGLVLDWYASPGQLGYLSLHSAEDEVWCVDLTNLSSPLFLHYTDFTTNCADSTSIQEPYDETAELQAISLHFTGNGSPQFSSCILGIAEADYQEFVEIP